MRGAGAVLGGRVLTPDGWRHADVHLADGRIAGFEDRVGSGETTRPDRTGDGGAAIVDAAGMLVVPGFVDLQCNGAFGIDLASEPERLWELSTALTRWGVTAWLPTIVTSPDDVVTRALAVLAAGPPAGWRGAVPLGLHLEGPFLSPAAAGAHRAALLQQPSVSLARSWCRDGGVAMVTLAPELDGAPEVIDALVAAGVVVSLGHTVASGDQVDAAVDRGAGMVTHLFNAMAPFHHREPGPVGRALGGDRLWVGLIADGVHVAPDVVEIAARLIGERLVLVTDAIGLAGRDDTAGDHGPISFTDGGARLSDGTLAGSVLTMPDAVANLVRFAGVDLADALTAASARPASVLVDDERGRIARGARADLTVLTPALEVVATLVDGTVVHHP